MTTATISIPVDPKTARAFSVASSERKRKMRILLGLRLRELTSRSARPLKEVMDGIAAKAKASGLTPKILESLLHEK